MNDASHSPVPTGPLSDSASPVTASPVTASVTKPTPGVPSDNATLLEILDGLRDQGYRNSFSSRDGGELACSSCGTTCSPERLHIDWVRRLEGASDPDDEMIVVAAACRDCGGLGVAVLGFGPSASAPDADVVGRLAVDRAESPQ